MQNCVVMSWLWFPRIFFVFPMYLDCVKMGLWWLKWTHRSLSVRKMVFFNQEFFQCLLGLSWDSLRWILWLSVRKMREKRGHTFVLPSFRFGVFCCWVLVFWGFFFFFGLFSHLSVWFFSCELFDIGGVQLQT